MKATEVVNKIKEHYDFKSDRELAKFLDISTQALSNWKSRNTYNENESTKSV